MSLQNVEKTLEELIKAGLPHRRKRNYKLLQPEHAKPPIVGKLFSESVVNN